MNASPARTSTTQNEFPRRTLFAGTIVFLLHFILVYVLDAAGLVESLLSPNGDRLVWVLPLAILLYAFRFAVYFVVPGLILGALVAWRWETSRTHRER